MKVALVVPVLITGGAETMAVRLAVGLKAAGEHIEVISIYPKQGTALEAEVECAGIPIHYVGKETSRSVSAIRQVYRILSEMDPDVIHSHISATFYALPWVMTHRVKLIHTIHTRPDAEFSGKLTNVLRLLVTLNKVKLVAVSKENQRIAKAFYGADDTKVMCVNNPVDTKRYYRNRCGDDEEIVFINVSRQDENKNQIMAIRAMAEVNKAVPNAKLVLVGNGTQHEFLKQERDALCLNDVVEIPGESTTPEHYLSGADIYISTSFREGLPLSMLEAMATGLPVISTDVGGIADIVRDNGVLIQPGDLAALTEQMICFATNRKMAERCGQKSKIIAQEFDVANTVRAYVEIYRTVKK